MIVRCDIIEKVSGDCFLYALFAFIEDQLVK